MHESLDFDLRSSLRSRPDMRAGDWQQWLNSLPCDTVDLAEVETDLQRQIVLAEARFRAAVWLGYNRVEERAARIEIMELNSKLIAIQMRVNVAS
ncbi:hypothetical protein [Deinococcus sp. QL22]|uniref:hypothetical protein n=1 Tax=Deinococcus sp. QL22 TaxID=2939437 RepID=UPI002017F396|nr:hypothetical protein [Deinococcus sp. QL22]UQN08234.1 hypothetical protein M1R55_19345 [Deinococcus sp. QL22]